MLPVHGRVCEKYFLIALECISPSSESFQGNSIKLIALQMGPIPPWIPKPAATSLNPISESTFPPNSLFLFDLLQNARHLGVWGFRITSCPRWSHGWRARQWRTVGMSSQPDIFICHPPSFPFSLSQRFPFDLLSFLFHQNRPLLLKASNNTSLRNIMHY